MAKKKKTQKVARRSVKREGLFDDATAPIRAIVQAIDKVHQSTQEIAVSTEALAAALETILNSPIIRKFR